MKCIAPLTKYIVTALLTICVSAAHAQTDLDGIMMNKQQFCTGLIYGSSKWDKYWEGTFFRENLNLGTVSSNSVMLMGNYGVKDNLNILFGLPYISNKASLGVLNGASGIQDLSAWVKWMPIEKDIRNSTISLYLLAGASTPLTDYIVDFLPLSIGLKSSTLSGRIMVDYQIGNFFATASETYTIRGNSRLERNSYFTTQLYLTDQVAMPDVNMVNIRAGYRSSKLIAEAIFSNTTTLGGFDISKNNMPFPSNRMNSNSVGVNIKYEINKVPGLSLVGGSSQVLNGRNVGKSTGVYGGVFYILNFSRKKKKETSTSSSSSTPKSN